MSDITGSEFNEDLSFLKPFSRLLLRISEEPGVGALFVIDAGGAALERLCRISPPPQTIWETLEPFNREQSGGDEQAEKQLEILYRLATMDGATLIRLAGDANAAVEQRWMRAKIFPRLLVTERFDLQKFWTTLENGKWAQWTEILSYGAKRNSAFALAMNTRDDASRLLVITVSADGPISFMIGGEDPVSKWPGDSRQSAKAPARVG